MSVLKIKAYAKVNLFLDVTGRRENGYHDVLTVMQSVSLSDTLTVERTQGEGVALDTGGVLPADDSNLICKAAKAYFAVTGAPFGVRVVLEKSIPMQAGMGGGSADAAAMLRALNTLDGDLLSDDELCRIAAGLGADVPFCLMGGTRLCRGIGEVMEPVPNRLSGTLVVAIGGEGVSTPVAFAALDAAYGNFKTARSGADVAPLLSAMEKGVATAAAPHFFNVFESVICPQRPFVGRIKDILLVHGAVAAMMSGSGPSVWGLFDDPAAARRAKEALLQQGARAYCCEMIQA